MATADEYAAWIVNNASKKGSPDFDTVARAYEEAKAEESSGGAKQQAGNLVAGLVRGAGSIGATLLAPVDAAARAVGIQNDYIGRTDRREAMTGALGDMGADTDSLAFKGGKLAAEVAGTAGVGGGIANAVTRVAPRVAAAAPNLLTAIRTSGMTAGPGGGAGNLLTRAAGGAVTGGVSAGLLNSDDTGTGALIGGAAPVVMKGLGMARRKAGAVLRGPAPDADTINAVNQARSAGYVIPPTQARPSLGNRLLEGMAGKITTAQNASARNQGVTNEAAAKALGLAPGTKITPAELQTIRQQAGQAYSNIGATGVITPGASYAQALDKIAQPFKLTAGAFPNAKPSPVLDLVESLRSPAFASASAVEKIKQLRSAADDAFRTGNTDVGRAARAGAAALEDAVEDHLKTIGKPALLQEFRDARQLIAKTYSVEKALNPATGTVDAKNLAAQLKKGKPLSGELRSAAEFAARFPRAAQPVEGMGSLPQTSPLDWGLAASVGAATQNPLSLLMLGARPAARALTLSGPVQNRLTAQGGNPLAALASPQAQQLLYRLAPVISGQ